jgi:ankyrin repeat protein
VGLLLQHSGHDNPMPDLVGRDRSASMEAFLRAVGKDDLKRVRGQLKYNSDLVFSTDINGWTPLHYAAKRGRTDLAELLLANKADVNAKDTGGATPLLWAAKHGHKDMVELLLAGRADVDAKESRRGQTSLHFAAEEGHKDVAELLLANRANVDARDNIDATPLHYAALKGHKDVVKLLLANQADVGVKDSKYGQTASDLAATGGHSDVAELLRRHHAMLSASLRGKNQEPIAPSRRSVFLWSSDKKN